MGYLELELRTANEDHLNAIDKFVMDNGMNYVKDKNEILEKFENEFKEREKNIINEFKEKFIPLMKKKWEKLSENVKKYLPNLSEKDKELIAIFAKKSELLMGYHYQLKEYLKMNKDYDNIEKIIKVDENKFISSLKVYSTHAKDEGREKFKDITNFTDSKETNKKMEKLVADL